MFRVVAVTGLIIAVADYVVVRMKMMKQLKMSKYEITQEYKQSEGDPHMKAHRKGVAMEMSRNRMMSDVAEADVLLVNPTHVAVALKYDPQKGAPRGPRPPAGKRPAAPRPAQARPGVAWDNVPQNRLRMLIALVAGA